MALKLELDSSTGQLVSLGKHLLVLNIKVVNSKLDQRGRGSRGLELAPGLSRSLKGSASTSALENCFNLTNRDRRVDQSCNTETGLTASANGEQL